MYNSTKIYSLYTYLPKTDDRCIYDLDGFLEESKGEELTSLFDSYEQCVKHAQSTFRYFLRAMTERCYNKDKAILALMRCSVIACSHTIEIGQAITDDILKDLLNANHLWSNRNHIVYDLIENTHIFVSHNGYLFKFEGDDVGVIHKALLSEDGIYYAEKFARYKPTPSETFYTQFTVRKDDLIPSYVTDDAPFTYSVRFYVTDAYFDKATTPIVIECLNF